MSFEAFGATRIDGPNDECRRLLLVGETNPYGADPRYALYNQPATSAGGRLQYRILAVNGMRHYLPIWRVNLCVGGWDPADGCRKASTLLDPDAPWTQIVMLGKKVRAAFERALFERGEQRELEWFGVTSVSSALPRRLISLPHPSGRNNIWNKDYVVQRARDIMRECVPGIPWGELA